MQNLRTRILDSFVKKKRIYKEGTKTNKKAMHINEQNEQNEKSITKKSINWDSERYGQEAKQRNICINFLIIMRKAS